MHRGCKLTEIHWTGRSQKLFKRPLETGNINPVLAYAPATAEAEIRAAFEKSRKVRGLGADARALANEAFMETVIRLHRAGEARRHSDSGRRACGGDFFMEFLLCEFFRIAPVKSERR